jgi:signal transduction histidine kinase
LSGSTCGVARNSHEEGMAWLTTSVVHDLRNPLAAIFAGSEILLEPDLSPRQVKRLAGNIHCAAPHMRALLAGLINQVQGCGPEAESCNLRELIAAASKPVLGARQGQNVKLELDVPAKIQVSLIRVQMEGVFVNLIANSCEAMPEGGEIIVRAHRAQDAVRIEVEDTGPGIPLCIRDQLFEPFKTAGKPNGLGLGLALSHDVIRRHGGDIWAEPAAGARFVIQLPLLSPPLMESTV